MKAQKYLLTGLLPLTLFLNSCSGESSNEASHSDTVQEKQIIELVENSINVEWTAYKTTEKLPVKGVFNEVKLETQLNKGESPEEILNDATVSIDINNLTTGNADRDVKIKTLFFGLMKDSGNIKGKLTYSDEKWKLNVTMNETTVNVPVVVNFEENTFHLKSTIQLAEFNALEMLASLNKACYDLHKGADGISKTWEEVDVEGTISFKSK